MIVVKLKVNVMITISFTHIISQKVWLISDMDVSTVTPDVESNTTI